MQRRSRYQASRFKVAPFKLKINANTPANHPSVDALLSLPVGHAPVDAYLLNPGAFLLPSWHITLESMILRQPPTVVTILVPIFYEHPNTDTNYAAMVPIPGTQMIQTCNSNIH